MPLDYSSTLRLYAARHSRRCYTNNSNNLSCSKVRGTLNELVKLHSLLIQMVRNISRSIFKPPPPGPFYGPRTWRSITALRGLTSRGVNRSRFTQPLGVIKIGIGIGIGIGRSGRCVYRYFGSVTSVGTARNSAHFAAKSPRTRCARPIYWRYIGFAADISDIGCTEDRCVLRTGKHSRFTLNESGFG